MIRTRSTASARRSAASSTGTRFPHEKVLAVGVNISGRVNSRTGYSYSYSYFFVEEQPLTLLLEERLDCPVYIENDTRAATYGEYMYGDAHNEQTMLYINASWGLGLGMIIDGKVFYGKSGFGRVRTLPAARQRDHLPLRQAGLPGDRRLRDRPCTGSSLEKLRQGSVSMLSDKFKRARRSRCKDILDAVLKEEDVLAIEILESVGHAGQGDRRTDQHVQSRDDRHRRSLSVAGESLMLPIRTAVNKYSLMLVYKDTQIKLSTLGERAGVIGACLLARSKALGLC